MNEKDRFEILRKPRTERANFRFPADLIEQLQKEADALGEKLGAPFTVTDIVVLKLFKPLDELK